jgi:hypothetical protein
MNCHTFTVTHTRSAAHDFAVRRIGSVTVEPGALPSPLFSLSLLYQPVSLREAKQSGEGTR